MVLTLFFLPLLWQGHSFRVHDGTTHLVPGVLAALVPSVIERRPRCGLMSIKTIGLC